MGLMTDGLHEKILAHVEVMIEAANGTVTPEVLGRYVATFYPEQAPQLPGHLRSPLTDAEMVTLRDTIARRTRSEYPGDFRPLPPDARTWS